jgi:uncharacterized protein YutE (UPF0331/DUF86 family)
VTAEGWEPYRASFERRKAAEKLLQELIEAAIDVNTHALVEMGAGAPADYYRSFTDLARHGWISDRLAGRLAPAAGLRNRLVHQYAAIDDRKVFEAIRGAVVLFPEYVAAIRARLEREAGGA